MSNPQHEPTMEEILASIRKIISEDAAEQPSAAPVPQPKAVQAVAQGVAQEEDDVLELTEEFSEQSAPAPEPRYEAAPASDKPDEIVFQSIEEPPMSEPVHAGQRPAEEPSSGGDIFSDKTRKALDDAFASIEQEPEEEVPAYRGPAAPVAPIEGSSIEALFDRAVRETFDPVLRNWLGENADAVVERMKPAIREWMDEHFPSMLEEAVRNEVARVAKSRRH